ncbi:MAG: hypothetical protein GX564_00940 [Oligosphaeraceae bacterium]|nr:hypothetical protein [Oligosphaeraceae bacterium]
MLKLGCAKRFTLPGKPSMLRGYGFRNQLSTGIEDPIEVGVLAISAGGDTVLCITADLIGIPLAYCNRLYALLAERFAIPAERVWLCSSHTHFAPGFDSYFITSREGALAYGEHAEDTEYFESWSQQMLDATAAALHSREEVTLESVTFEVPGIAFNRRTRKKLDGKVEMSWTYPDRGEDFQIRPHDSRVHAWRFSTAQGPKAILACCGCHPVTGYRDAYAISADYPWYFKQAVERLYGCPGFFLLGAAGDVVPMLRGSSDIQRSKCPINPRAAMGEILAATMRLNELAFRKIDRPRLSSTVIEVPVTVRQEYDFAQAEQNYRRAEAGNCAPEELSWRRDAWLCCRKYPAESISLPLRLLQLGDQILTGMPFEVLSGVSLCLREAVPNAVLVSITGGYQGYLPLQEEFPLGGYEVSLGGTDFSPGTGDKFLQAAIAGIRRL